MSKTERARRDARNRAIALRMGGVPLTPERAAENIARMMGPADKVCPNCRQWVHAFNNDCLNECRRRGFVR